MDKILWHQSGVSPTGEPFIQLLLDTEIIAQLSPKQARDHAQSIIEAAEAAEQDAFMMEFFQKVLDTSFQEAGKVLIAYRNYRAEKTGKSQGPRKPQDWVLPPKDKIPDYFTKKDPSND